MTENAKHDQDGCSGPPLKNVLGEPDSHPEAAGGSASPGKARFFASVQTPCHLLDLWSRHMRIIKTGS